MRTTAMHATPLSFFLLVSQDLCCRTTTAFSSSHLRQVRPSSSSSSLSWRRPLTHDNCVSRTTWSLLFAKESYGDRKGLEIPGENATTTATVVAPPISPSESKSSIDISNKNDDHVDSDDDDDDDDKNNNSNLVRNNDQEDENDALTEIRDWLQTNVFMGIPLTPEVAAIVTVYFVQGALGLARLAKTYLLKDELALGPAELSALTGLFALPWTIKPLYGFLSDGFPLFNYRRKSYLILAGILGSASYGLLSFSPLWDSMSKETAVVGTVAVVLVASASVAMSDVVTDGIVVTRTRQASNSGDAAMAGGLQSLCWGASAIGSIISAYWSGSLLEQFTVRQVFGWTAVLPLLVALIATRVDETPVVAVKATTKAQGGVVQVEAITKEEQDDEEEQPGLLEGVQGQVAALKQAFSQDSIWKPALFLFLWQSTPTADGAFFYFISNDLGLGPEFMGRVRLVTSVASLAGVALYNQYLKRVAIKDILFWSTIISVPLGLIPPLLLVTHSNQALGIPDQALIYGDDVVLAALGEIAFLPTLVLAARLCPPGIEAVLFASLMSIFNGAGTVGTEIGAFLTKVAGITESNFDNLAALLVVCNFTSLYPLVFIGWLDKVGEVSEADLAKEEENQSSTSVDTN